MAGWSGSDRRERLPSNWQQIRRRILRRDGNRCTWVEYHGARCEELATEVDHIVAGDNHDDSNLRSLCTWHHARKSASEGAAASAAKRRRIEKRFRRTEDHPGLT
ncbi:HNH endonuclease [Streptomyces phage Aaronocolus]|uniref:HNH endonuclease n=10 Tax=Likavirus TaxID=1982880 RepID=A0A411CVC5_9CAUD|nr:HNH endonuclease [Streptomyces phage Caliburn]YP_009616427.1 HNH endonuclease [Streptomyces phage Aaronocolus]YP_009616501.1 HNH endonuclease [Streptomyces phage Hydra]ATE84880.1 HNH endonuclease [Streptomyces phage BeardedLady]ATE85182.1 HNH endonuclease [Streptomyces phage Esperer]QAY17205.1 HNH endonuclease [Streptomyces phage Bovely]QAY17278.1 HNH endonuclease [Streptomyces phage Indigo]QAY17820.1 HNH endonuclease [Streptomyces phage Nerdos]QDK03367.1 HNH endonuclease [Streptomyces p